MGWKIYFWGLLILLAFSYISLFSSNPNMLAYIDTVISVIALIGLYGYAFKRKIFRFNFWKSFFFVIVVWNFCYIAYLQAHSELNATTDLLINFISFSIALPGYIAIYLYGFKSKFLWN
jgi:hypothetical protein